MSFPQWIIGSSSDKLNNDPARGAALDSIVENDSAFAHTTSFGWLIGATA